VSHGIPRGAVILASVIGGATALGAHASKATLRAVSTATTAGVGNPVLSVFEDAFAFVNAAAAIFLPWLVMLVVVLLSIAILMLRTRLKNRRRI
jgi:hypothetical protein